MTTHTARKRRSSRSRRYRIAAIIVLCALVCLVFLVPHPDPTAVDMSATFAPPGADHLLGTDHLGRDLWARIAVGFWRTLVVVVVSSATSVALGVVMGICAGYRRGIVKTVVMFVTDLVMIVPTFIGALIFASIFGLSPLTAGLLLGFFGIGPFVNQSCALVQSVKNCDYLLVERLMGTPAVRILYHHVLPAITGPILAYLGSSAGANVLAYAGLSYIGLGVDSTIPDWGTMLNEYRAEMVSHPWLVIAPTLGILLLSVTCHVVFDSPRREAYV